jgi:hypothetical protein
MPEGSRVERVRLLVVNDSLQRCLLLGAWRSYQNTQPADKLVVR